MMLMVVRMFTHHPTIRNIMTTRLSKAIIQDQGAPDLDSLEYIPDRNKNQS